MQIRRYSKLAMVVTNVNARERWSNVQTLPAVSVLYYSRVSVIRTRMLIIIFKFKI